MTEIIFFLLCGKRPEVWSSYDAQTLYDTTLRSSECIYRSFHVHEIDRILQIFQRSALQNCQLRINPKLNKLGKCNLLAFILGHTKRHFLPKKKRISLQSLAALCELEIKRSVPENVIRVGLAHWKFNVDLNKWLDNSPVPITMKVPVEPYTFDLFSYPDISLSRSLVESRIIDPSHCLTNLHVHATQKGIFGCDPKALWKVSESDNSILNKAFLIEPIPDKQSVPFAERIFSSKVEQAMRSNGDMKEAELVKHI